MRLLGLLGVMATLAVTAACMDMDVENINDPDADQALAESSDVEALLGTAFYRWMNGTKKRNAATPTGVAANEITSSWGNFGMQNAGTLPRGSYDNSPTAPYSIHNRAPWNNIYEGLSNAADAMFAVTYQELEFGEDGEDTERGLAFGKFSQGVLTGWLALYYDQAYVFDEDVLANIEEADPQLLPYEQVMDQALQYFEEAIEIAETAPEFELPVGEDAWIHGNALNNEQLIEWSHSFMASYIASLPRTPAQREAVDWNQVLFHLDRGVTEDVGPVGEQSPVLWWSGMLERPDGWIRAAYDLVGPADTSGNYEAWLASAPGDKDPFLIHTADRRITGPDGPESEGKYMRIATPFNLFPVDRGQYFQSAYFGHRNHGGEHGYDTQQLLFGELQMDHWRAEAYLRLGQNREEAIDLINVGRVENGELEPIPYDVSDEELWEVFLYEKAIEQAMQYGTMLFFDRRGFGTLICGTPLHYPIHGRELELLQIPIYTFGGSGEGAADPSTGCRTHNEDALSVVR